MTASASLMRSGMKMGSIPLQELIQSMILWLSEWFVHFADDRAILAQQGVIQIPCVLLVRIETLCPWFICVIHFPSK